MPKEATLKKLLDVIACLMNNVTAPEEFIKWVKVTMSGKNSDRSVGREWFHGCFRRIGPLFSKAEGRGAHEALVRMVEGLLANEGVEKGKKDLLREVVELESWDRSRIDEPDHDRRHAAYNRLNDVSSYPALIHRLEQGGGGGRGEVQP